MDNKLFYDIAIDYQTGDSFNTESIKGERIGIITSDLDKAKENLLRIKKQYLKYLDIDCYSGAFSKIKLLTDEGVREISPFWIGYFETLYRAEIVMDLNDDSLVVYFDR